MMSVDVLRACAVLQDCADRLSVLGNILRSGADTTVSAGVSSALEQQRTAEVNLKTARQGLMPGTSLSDATVELHRSQKQLKRTIEESPLSRDSLTKVQRDRQFVSEVINGLMAELQEKNTFQSLFSAVEEERKKKAHLLEIINREEEGHLRIKALQRQLLDIQKEKTEECTRLEESVAHLRVQVQDMRMMTEKQIKYVKNSAEQLVKQTLKLNSKKETELEGEVRMLQERLEAEKKFHTEMETFLKSVQTNLQEKLEFWIERYETQIEKKEQELTTLQNKKTSNQAQLQKLAKKYRESEQIIIEDRLKKEQLHIQLEKEQMERDAATKIQSWWRGTLVRRGMGSLKKSKKPKPKTGKKPKKK